MSKFCGNCGAMANDADRICGNCGAPFADAPAPNYNNPAAYSNIDYSAPAADPLAGGAQQIGTKKIDFKNLKGSIRSMDKKQLLTYGGICLAAVVLLIVIISLIAGNAGGKGTVKKYLKAIKKQDESKIASLIYSDDVDDEAEWLAKRFDDYDSVKYKIVDTSTQTKYELKQLKERLENRGYDDADDIKKAVTVLVKLTTKDDDGKSVDYRTYTVVKIHGKWKVYS